MSSKMITKIIIIVTIMITINTIKIIPKKRKIYENEAYLKKKA